MLAEVFLRQATSSFDRLYSYRVPAEYEESLKAGMRILVPFGRGNRLVEALVFRLREEEPAAELKEIVEVLDQEALISASQLRLIAQLKQRYACTYGAALNLLLPAALNLDLQEEVKLIEQAEPQQLHELKAAYPKAYGPGGFSLAFLQEQGFSRQEILSLVKDKLLELNYAYKQQLNPSQEEYVSLTKPKEASNLLEDESLGSWQQEAAVLYLLAEGKSLVKEVLAACQIKRGSLKTLEKKGLVNFTKEAVQVSDLEVKSLEEAQLTVSPPVADKDLTNSQKETISQISKALESTEKGKPQEFLVHGVTGSGKTEVYLRLAAKARELGQQVLILVPEISLTPQMLARFTQRFDQEIAVWHSQLSARERFNIWQKIRMGLYPLVIGVRSAIFAPLDNLGLIIIDEEHDRSYLSDYSPRYDARTVARLRALNEGASLVLGSATPALETYLRAQGPKTQYLQLASRPGQVSLPQVELIDLREYWNPDTQGLLSEPLLAAMEQRLSKNEQVLLFLNRRSYATQAVCMSCGQGLECPSCAVGLSYHRDKQRLMCHYCGYLSPLPHSCPHCGESSLILHGAGTQRLEELCQQYFPQTTIIRMDQDVTRRAGSHAQKLQEFSQAQAAILLGTQMVSKGHDFPRLTLVAIVNADQLTGRNDYRAGEEAFQLITQTIGRAGRHDLAGKAMIQAFDLDHYALHYAAKQDYFGFAQEELRFRQSLAYPPYTVLGHLLISGLEQKATASFASQVYEQLQALRQSQKKWQAISVLKPALASLERLQGRWRYQILLRSKAEGGVELLSTLWQRLSLEPVPENLRLSFRLDPA